jgi:hypothetical protein
VLLCDGTQASSTRIAVGHNTGDAPASDSPHLLTVPLLQCSSESSVLPRLLPRCISIELRQGTAVLGTAAVQHDVLVNADSEGVCCMHADVHVCIESTFRFQMDVYSFCSIIRATCVVLSTSACHCACHVYMYAHLCS